jgi:hypothetical protein
MLNRAMLARPEAPNLTVVSKRAVSDSMAKPAEHEPTFQTVRNAKTGQPVVGRGVGALKGQLTLKKGVDLTKPIASQTLEGGKSSVPRKR